MNLKVLPFYLFLIATPLLIMVLFSKMGSVNSTEFTISLLFYSLIYHPLISGIRLYFLGVIHKKDIIKNLIPFWNFKFYPQLFSW